MPNSHHASPPIALLLILLPNYFNIPLRIGYLENVHAAASFPGLHAQLLSLFAWAWRPENEATLQHGHGKMDAPPPPPISHTNHLLDFDLSLSLSVPILSVIAVFLSVIAATASLYTPEVHLSEHLRTPACSQLRGAGESCPDRGHPVLG